MAKARRHISPRKLPIQERSRETVDCILQATARILEREGILALTTNRVAREAGVSVGSLYQYFPGKEALLSALVEKRLHADQAFFGKALHGFESWTIEEKITRLVAAGIELHRRDRRILKVMFEQLSASGHLELVNEMNLQIFHTLKAALSSHPRWSGRGEEIETKSYVYMQTILGVWHSQVERRWLELDAAKVGETVSRMILSDIETCSERA